jgi:two-component system, OmpR family, response regulator
MSPSTYPPSERPATVLLVDDNPSNLRSAEAFLRSKGFVVSTSSSPFGVTAIVQRLLPDVIVLDIMMPGLDGHDLASLLRRVSRSPIVFFSAMPEEQLRDLVGRFDNATYVLKSEGLAYLAQEVGRREQQSRRRARDTTV